jgi:hypothetical protein
VLSEKKRLNTVSGRACFRDPVAPLAPDTVIAFEQGYLDGSGANDAIRSATLAC